MKGVAFLTILLVLCAAAQSSAATYKGIAVDQTTGEPVEGLRILCHQFEVDHGLGNRIRAKLIGHDFADVDSSIMDAVVTGSDGTFELTSKVGTPMSTLSVFKNGSYGIYKHNVQVSKNMVIKIPDEPLELDESKTEVYQTIPDSEEQGLILFATKYVGNGYVFCLDSLTGEIIWKDLIYWEATTPVQCKNGRAFVGTDGGLIFAYDIETGKRLWQFQTRQEVGTFVLDDQLLYVSGGGNNEVLMAIDQPSGRVQRSFDTDRQITGMSMLSDHLVVWGERNLALLRTPDLRLVASREVTLLLPPLVSSNSIIAIITGFDYSLIVYDLDTLSPVWEKVFPRVSFRGPVLFDDTVAVSVGKEKKVVHAFDLETGLSRWTYEIEEIRSEGDLFADFKQLYVGTGQRTMCCLNKDGGLIWDADLGFQIDPMEMAVDQDHLFVFGASALRCIDTHTGGFLWVNSSQYRFARGTPVVTTDGVFLAEEIGELVRVNRENGEEVWRFKCKSDIRSPVTYLKKD